MHILKVWGWNPGKRRLSALTLLIAAALGLALLGARQRETPLSATAILTEKEAFVTLPPEVIVPGGTKRVIPSPEGDFVLAQRVAVAPIRSLFPDNAPPRWAELSLILWNATTRRTTILWRRVLTEDDLKRGDLAQPAGVENIEDVEWLPQTSNAFLRFATAGADGEVKSRRLMVVDATRGTLRSVAEMAPEDDLMIAPDRPQAILYRKAQHGFQILGAKGVPGPLITLSDPSVLPFAFLPDGNTLVGMRRPAAGAERVKPQWMIVDLKTGVTSSVEKRPRIAQQPPAPPLALTIRSRRDALKEGEAVAEVSPLWLSGAGKEASGVVLLSPDAEQPVLLPKAALYQQQGALFAVPILRLERATYTKLLMESQRRQTLNNAKQIGLALVMYCMDYDENFPPPGDGRGIAEVANPYLKNLAAFNDVSTGKFAFTPAYKSSSLSSYSTPATTPLGYLSGPGGRVIIYVDGHVAWE